MRGRITRKVSLACATLAVCHTVALPGPISCNDILRTSNLEPRALYNLSSGSGFPNSTNTLQHASHLNLAYVIPGHPYNSGAVIIKFRHQVVTSKPDTNPKISLHRDRYKIPCVQKHDADVSEFAGDSDTQRYIAYHRYGLPDNRPSELSLDRLHADIGNRPSRSWYESNQRCASTSDWDIAPQFLFEESYAERQSPGLISYFRYRVNSAYETAGDGNAYAAPPSYSSYRGLTVNVKPYRKPANSLSCISFGVDVPANATKTDVMIIDADDARYPRVNLLIDPQRTWSFSWQ